MVDFATQLLLVVIGFALVFSPEILTENIQLGRGFDLEQCSRLRSPSRCSPTPGSRRSRTSQRRRETPVRTVPNAYKLVALAVFAIYFTLPAVALSALPVKLIDGEWTTLLALPPEEGGYSSDPILGLVQNLGLEGWVLSGLEIYVGVLAATILFIATHAGVIGASRITYSMASYQQIPEIFRRLHPQFKTPWLSLLVFAGIIPILLLLPGDVNFIGTLYSLGATLSFTVAHASLVRLRMADATTGFVPPYKGRPSLTLRGVHWPLFAIFGGIATGASFLVIVIQNPTTRWVGLGWTVFGLIGYAVYRRRVVGVGLRETVKAPPAMGAALALEYRRILVPIVPGRASDDALDVALRLAKERGARVIALSVIEIPLDLPLDAELPELEAAANRQLDEAVAVGDSYDVRVTPRLVRGRSASIEIVDEANRRDAEIIVLGSPRKALTERRRGVFGATVDRVMRNAPCRVMVTASRTRVAAERA